MHELPSEKFAKEFHTKIHEYPGGDELLWSLKLKGCGLDFILMFLELHCGARVESQTRESIDAHKGKLHLQAEKLDDFARSLSIMSNEIEANNKGIAGWLVRYGQKPFELPDEVRSYASFVQAISKELHDVSLRTAPMDALNLLVDCMITTEADVTSMVNDLEQKKDLTEQPESAQPASVIAARAAQAQRMKASIGKIDYEGLALLMEAGYSALGTTKTVDIGALRHLVERARDRRLKKGKAA